MLNSANLSTILTLNFHSELTTQFNKNCTSRTPMNESLLKNGFVSPRGSKGLHMCSWWSWSRIWGRLGTRLMKRLKDPEPKAAARVLVTQYIQTIGLQAPIVRSCFQSGTFKKLRASRSQSTPLIKEDNPKPDECTALRSRSQIEPLWLASFESPSMPAEG